MVFDPGAAVVLSGTVLKVLCPARGGGPWRALFEPRGLPPAYLCLPSAPSGIGEGDDLHMQAHVVSSGDPRFPDHLVPCQPNDAAPVPPSMGIRSLGLDMSSMHGTRMVAPGIMGTPRSRCSPDPVIEWALARFGDGDTARLRAPAVMVLDPAATPIPPSHRTGKVRRLVNAWRGRLPIPADGDESRKGLSRLMPALATEEQRLRLAGRVGSGPVHVRDHASLQGRNVGMSFVVPFDPVQTGFSAWRTFSGLSALGFMPRTVMSPRALAMITVGHELGHAHEEALGHDLGHEKAKVNMSECFADAVGLIAYVLDHGDVQGATDWAAARALGTLTSAQSYATGPACAMALAEAARLRMRHPQGPVATREILRVAETISTRCHHPSPSDLELVRAMVRQDTPGWARLSVAGMRQAFMTAIARCPDLVDRKATVRSFDVAMDAMERGCFLPSDLENSVARREAATVEGRDLLESARSLHGRGMGWMTGNLLGHAARAVILEGACGLLRRERMSAIRKVAIRTSAWTDRAVAAPRDAVTILPGAVDGAWAPGSHLGVGTVIGMIPVDRRPGGEEMVGIARAAWCLRVQSDAWSRALEVLDHHQARSLEDLASSGPGDRARCLEAFRSLVSVAARSSPVAVPGVLVA